MGITGMQRYYVFRKGERRGPFEFERLEELARRRKIEKSDRFVHELLVDTGSTTITWPEVRAIEERRLEEAIEQDRRYQAELAKAKTHDMDTPLNRFLCGSAKGWATMFAVGAALTGVFLAGLSTHKQVSLSMFWGIPVGGLLPLLFLIPWYYGSCKEASCPSCGSLSARVRRQTDKTGETTGQQATHIQKAVRNTPFGKASAYVDGVRVYDTTTTYYTTRCVCKFCRHEWQIEDQSTVVTGVQEH